MHVFYKAMLIFFDKHYRHSNRWLAPFIQMAVVVRGILDLCMHQKERLFGWVGRGRDREADKSYLFLGRPEAVESLCRLGLENNLK